MSLEPGRAPLTGDFTMGPYDYFMIAMAVKTQHNTGIILIYRTVGPDMPCNLQLRCCHSHGAVETRGELTPLDHRQTGRQVGR